MSCGPVGLDAREYYYEYEDLEIPGGAAPTDVYRIDAANSWLVTRIRYWAGAAGGGIGLENHPSADQSDIAANGCICLEPNGAYRGRVYVKGPGSRVVVEYWYQVNETGDPPSIVVVV